MAGISSYSLIKLDNKRGFNSNEIQDKEFSDGSGLELYDFNARTYDQQIGRFIQIDPMTEEGGQETLSPYHFSYNNPIRYNDPDGREPEDGDPPGGRSILRGVVNGAVNFAKAIGKPQIVTLGEVTVAALNGDLKPAISLLAPAINKTDDAIAFVNGDAQTRAEIITGTTLEFGTALAGEKILPRSRGVEVKAAEVKIEKAYERPNNATTKEQRASVQGQPCVKCGNTTKPMVAGHKKALVKEYYETGKIDKIKMRSKGAVQPECTTCSAKEGAEMSKYSKEQKKKNGL